MESTDAHNFWIAIKTELTSPPTLFGPYTLNESQDYREHLLLTSPPLAEVRQVIEADCRSQAEDWVRTHPFEQ